MDEELKKKAFSFGKKVFDFSKNAAKHVADEVSKGVKEFEEQEAMKRLQRQLEEKDYWSPDAREGTIQSALAVDDLWLPIMRECSRNIGHLSMSMRGDDTILRLTGRVDYTEKLPLPDVIRQLTVTIDFQPRENGTTILYSWHIYEIPPGGYLNDNIIKMTNQRIKNCADLLSP